MTELEKLYGTFSYNGDEYNHVHSQIVEWLKHIRLETQENDSKSGKDDIFEQSQI